ncbi:hypothetical protein PAAG_11606 [Paracoccidioides lutzii Pb01]|uniref:Uncharacterized protein n=1 Tax=Paracoccidioides lutzii (strain ATCC MYA-826 / Pb01) TaxID=502779 RepID=A0A0A2VL89_PARBA|nr:hypothetical protein PAAG_11606 [Paracoccidioides lutzii Pb01]KGQ01624.1 hypothetical protein PAAG_11606 [Paracoccidioides lutzii Pb01]
MAAAARSDHARIYGEHLLGGVREESLAEQQMRNMRRWA